MEILFFLLFFLLYGIGTLVVCVFVPMAIMYATRRIVWRIGNACPPIRAVCYALIKERL